MFTYILHAFKTKAYMYTDYCKGCKATSVSLVLRQLITRCLPLLQPPPAKYGGRHTVTLIPGDGIGPELLNHVREVFRLVRLKLNPA